MTHTYPYKDCLGVPFRVEPAQNKYPQLPDHEWVVFMPLLDESGPYDYEADTVDDCDTEEEAVAAWQSRRKDVLEAFELGIG